MPPRGRPKRGAPPRRASDQPPTTCTLKIDRFAAGGDAVAVRDDGKTVFVADAVPGDVVRVTVVEERKRFAKARVEAVIEPSPDRVEPACRHFGRCGGCTWQHVRYPKQVDAKARILRDALERIGGFRLDADPPMTASPEPLHYRGRARVRVDRERVGFLERSSHRLCAVEMCPVLAPELEQAVLGLGRADVADGEWSLTVGVNGEVSSLSEATREDEAKRPAPVELEVQGRRVALDARAFSQANRLLHATLVERVLDVALGDAGDTSGWRVLEVHAGVGFFTGALADRVGRVVAVEADPHAASWLAQNVATRVDVIASSFEAAASRLGDHAFDAVVLDPPRAGLAPAELATLRDLGAPRIAYLSCDPATLARDARGLADAGYRLEQAEGFDLFPQTHHVEGLVRLARA